MDYDVECIYDSNTKHHLQTFEESSGSIYYMFNPLNASVALIYKPVN